MDVFAADMNRHIGSSNVGYDGTHGGFGHRSRNADLRWHTGLIGGGVET